LERSEETGILNSSLEDIVNNPTISIISSLVRAKLLFLYGWMFWCLGNSAWGNNFFHNHNLLQLSKEVFIIIIVIIILLM